MQLSLAIVAAVVSAVFALPYDGEALAVGAIGTVVLPGLGGPIAWGTVKLINRGRCIHQTTQTACEALKYCNWKGVNPGSDLWTLDGDSESQVDSGREIPGNVMKCIYNEDKKAGTSAI